MSDFFEDVDAEVCEDTEVEDVAVEDDEVDVEEDDAEDDDEDDAENDDGGVETDAGVDGENDGAREIIGDTKGDGVGRGAKPAALSTLLLHSGPHRY